jgi:hypothetical protein
VARCSGHATLTPSSTAEGDPGTGNLLGDIIQMHEKQPWFLRETLQLGDGLVLDPTLAVATPWN